jgi:hypothetical protein
MYVPFTETDAGFATGLPLKYQVDVPVGEYNDVRSYVPVTHPEMF